MNFDLASFEDAELENRLPFVDMTRDVLPFMFDRRPEDHGTTFVLWTGSFDDYGNDDENEDEGQMICPGPPEDERAPPEPAAAGRDDLDPPQLPPPGPPQPRAPPPPGGVGAVGAAAVGGTSSAVIKKKKQRILLPFADGLVDAERDRPKTTVRGKGVPAKILQQNDVGLDEYVQVRSISIKFVSLYEREKRYAHVFLRIRFYRPEFP